MNCLVRCHANQMLLLKSKTSEKKNKLFWMKSKLEEKKKHKKPNAAQSMSMKTMIMMMMMITGRSRHIHACALAFVCVIVIECLLFVSVKIVNRTVSSSSDCVRTHNAHMTNVETKNRNSISTPAKVQMERTSHANAVYIFITILIFRLNF